jgi:PBP1b-binding outer membrane lipoprotein LpoB
MKKLVLILSVIGFFTACSTSNEEKVTNTDSTSVDSTSVDSTAVILVDSISTDSVEISVDSVQK